MSAWAQCRTPSIAAEPVSPEVAPTIVTRRPCCDKHVLEQAPDELQGDVLERQGGSVEQLLEEVFVADLHQWRDRGMGECRIGIDAHRRQGRR